MKRLRKPLVAAAIIITVGASLAFSAGSSFFEITKNLDIFTTLYKELNTYYVDTLNPEKLMRAGITEMLGSLDPYTDFIPEEDLDEYRTQTTGKYGGIGALIGTRNEWVIVTEPYETFPADKAGLRAGDKIVEVDGKSAKNYKTDQVSAMLKGKPGTEVTVKIARQKADGTEEELVKKMTREEIKIKNVPYYSLMADNIAYIRLSSFTDRAGNEVKNALQNLEQQARIKGIILDLRGNPGGLLHEAINVANVFVNKDVEVVSTKGKIDEWNKSFTSLNDPVDLKTNLVVLTDGGSASAAEIVSGSLQDLDRAVIVGQKTFGKGLVQSTRSLPYGTKLKITTAKYYIPSGRCIQAINYAERNEDGSVKHIPDSLKVAFKTKNGRKVWDGGGIDPDVALEPEKLSNAAIGLYVKNYYFEYANIYRTKHETITSAKKFELSDAEYKEFTDWVKKKEFDYSTRTEKVLEELKSTATKEKMLESIQADYDAMKAAMMRDKENDLMKQKAQIKSLLEEEIVSRYYLATGRLESAFRNDAELKKAIEILGDDKRIKEILAKTNGK